jgi:hypothetical protein
MQLFMPNVKRLDSVKERIYYLNKNVPIKYHLYVNANLYDVFFDDPVI